jgi:hypothetical protein
VPLTRYLDLVLLADQLEFVDGRVASFMVRVLSSPAGEGEEAERVKVPDHLPAWVGWLDVRQIDTDLGAQIELGTILGGLLLPPYARGLFQASLGRLADDEGLRLRLRLADELADLPWEFAWVGRHRGKPTAAGFLALDPRISIVRHESVATPLPTGNPTAPAGRRVVVAQASPDGYPALKSLAAERQSLEEALAGVAGVTTEFVSDASRAAVLQAVTAGADVFHFGGHGTVDPDGGGSVVLAGPANQADLLPAVRLAEIVQAKGVRLAVLGACDTGRRPGPGPGGATASVWGGVATALMQRGIPAVVAMQFTIGDRRAAAFAGATYRALVGGLTIDEAVALGRTAIRTASTGKQADDRDWAVPVLYLRDGGDRLFEPVAEPAARDQAVAESARLYEQRVGRVAAGGLVLGAVLGPDSVERVSIRLEADVVEGLAVGAVGTSAGGVHVDEQVDEVAAGGTLVGGADSPEALARALEVLRGLTPPKDG